MKTTRRTLLTHCTALAAAGLAPRPCPAQAQPAGPVVLVLGDSLSAEYGLARGQGWVALLSQRLAAEPRHKGLSVVNASISGDTTAGGRSRLPALIKRHRPAVVVIELGGNDALRGLPLAMTRDNLQAMARAAKEAGAKVLLLGMQIPPNYGRRYSDDFAAAFPAVARQEGAALVPFLLQGVGDALFQADRIHPRADAHPTMLANVWPVLKPLLPVS